MSTEPWGLTCPHCGCEDTRVGDTRKGRASVRRRRICEKCGYAFTTRERPVGVGAPYPSAALEPWRAAVTAKIGALFSA